MRQPVQYNPPDALVPHSEKVKETGNTTWWEIGIIATKNLMLNLSDLST